MKKLMLLGLLTIGGSVFAQAQVSDNFVLATIDGKPLITFGDLVKEYPFVREYMSGLYFNYLVNDTLLHLWAEKKGLKNNPEFKERVKKETDEAIKSYGLQNDSDEEKHKLTKGIEQSIIRKLIEDELKKGIKIDLAEIQEDYEQNKDHYIKGNEKIKVQAVNLNNDAEARSFIIDAVRNSKSADLESLAKQYNAKIAIEEFEYNPRMEIKNGDYTSSILHKMPIDGLEYFGNKVYKIIERIAPPQEFVPLESVKNEIIDRLLFFKVAKIFPEYLAKLKKEFNVDDSMGKKFVAEKEEPRVA